MKKEETKDTKKKVTKKTTTKTEKKPVAKAKTKTTKTSSPKPKKPATKKTTKKVKEEPIILDNDIVKLEEVETKAEEKPNKFIDFIKKYKKLILSVVGIIAVIAIICAIVKGSGMKTYKLYEVSPTFEGSEETITLPKDWLLTDDGEYYELNDNRLHAKGFISGMPATQEDYDLMIGQYVQYYDVEQVTINEIEGIKLIQEYDNNTFHYYFIYKNDVIHQVTFVNVDDALENQILTSIK